VALKAALFYLHRQLIPGAPGFLCASSCPLCSAFWS